MEKKMISVSEDDFNRLKREVEELRAENRELRRDSERYDYREQVTYDVKDAVYERYTKEEIRDRLEDRNDFEEELNDDLFVSDSVTGNASGSYYCNTWKAENALMHNLDLLGEAVKEFGGSCDILEDGAEACDVTIRCYLLAECISDALDEIEDELEEKEEESENEDTEDEE